MSPSQIHAVIRAPKNGAPQHTKQHPTGRKGLRDGLAAAVRDVGARLSGAAGTGGHGAAGALAVAGVQRCRRFSNQPARAREVKQSRRRARQCLPSVGVEKQ